MSTNRPNQAEGEEAGGQSHASAPWQRCSCGLFFQQPLLGGYCPKCAGKTPHDATPVSDAGQPSASPPTVVGPPGYAINPPNLFQNSEKKRRAGVRTKLIVIGIVAATALLGVVVANEFCKLSDACKVQTKLDKTAHEYQEKYIEELRSGERDYTGRKRATEPTPVATTKEVPANGTETKQINRNEFKSLVIGKTESQLINLLGKPAETFSVGPWDYWVYNHRTKDPLTDKVDGTTQLVIQDGKCTTVNFLGY
jgi:hypothetical protein